MKLIFSRKGFDSSAGGVPSPIFPDGRMVSLPIPDERSKVSYADISYNGASLGPLVAQLTGGRIPAHSRAHIDPDLAQDSLPRLAGWRPIFGQTGPAQGHLRNNGVGLGDLFYSSGSFGVLKSGMGSIHGSKMFDHATSFGDGCRLRKFCRSRARSLHPVMNGLNTILIFVKKVNRTM